MLPIQKKSRARNFNVKPFPTEILASATFTGYDVEVFDPISIKTIYESGCFGMNPKPRQFLAFNHHQKMKSISEAEYRRRLEWKEKFGDPEDVLPPEMILVGDQQVPNPFNIPHSLVLFLEEAFFLQSVIGCLEVKNLSGAVISTEKLWEKFCGVKKAFVETYVAYLHFKSKNWVIKSGMKFGGDFLLYKQSPQTFHASFIVIVNRAGATQKSTLDYHTSERVAETTGKNLLYLEVVFPPEIDPSTYLTHLDKFEVNELVTRRHELIK